MSRPDIADYLGLTIESNLVSTEISGSLRRNRSAELAAHCAAQLLRTEHLTSRAHAGIGQTWAHNDHADSNGRSISPLRAQRTKWSIRTPASRGDNAAGWSAAEFLRHGNKNPW